MEKKKAGTGKHRMAKVKDVALKVGHAVEDTIVRKHDGPNGEPGMDNSMNTANFAIFQGAGLETLDSRGLGREWTRRTIND